MYLSVSSYLLFFTEDEEQPQAKRKRKEIVLIDYLDQKSKRDFWTESKRIALEKEKFEHMKKAAEEDREYRKRQLELEERK